MSIRTTTYLLFALGAVVLIFSFIRGIDDPVGIAGFGFVAFVFLFVLRCPRCWAFSWTRRWVKGRVGFLFQYTVIPNACHCCGLDFRKHRLWEKIGWK